MKRENTMLCTVFACFRYIENMDENQDSIYYMSGDSIDVQETSLCSTMSIGLLRPGYAEESLAADLQQKGYRSAAPRQPFGRAL